jgi:hypothetical protein
MVSARWSGLACDVVRQVQAWACVKTELLNNQSKSNPIQATGTMYGR